MNIMKTLCTTILLAGAAIASNGVAAAERVIEERIVSFADLNLDQPAGVQILYGRIRSAARSACLAVVGLDPHLGSVRRDCIRDALGGAVESVDHHRLTVFHMDRTSEPGGPTIARR